MAMITIGGVALPNPIVGGYKVYNRDIDSENTTRTETARLQRDRIRTKMYAIDVTWNVKGADYQKVINALAPAKIVVNFYNPNDGAYYTQTDMYAGDRAATLLDYQSETDPSKGLWELSTTLTIY